MYKDLEELLKHRTNGYDAGHYDQFMPAKIVLPRLFIAPTKKQCGDIPQAENVVVYRGASRTASNSTVDIEWISPAGCLVSTSCELADLDTSFAHAEYRAKLLSDISTDDLYDEIRSRVGTPEYKVVTMPNDPSDACASEFSRLLNIGYVQKSAQQVGDSVLITMKYKPSKTGGAQ